jgi:hypothetical protein
VRKEERKSLLFCEQKRSKKNFDSRGRLPVPGSHRREAEQSFFGSFFSKKELLSFFLAVPHG